MKPKSVALLTDGELELIVIEEFSRAEKIGLAVSRDCELTLARMVAEKIRRMEREHVLGVPGTV